jgi:hypothetical protein
MTETQNGYPTVDFIVNDGVHYRWSVLYPLPLWERIETEERDWR